MKLVVYSRQYFLAQDLSGHPRFSNYIVVLFLVCASSFASLLILFEPCIMLADDFLNLELASLLVGAHAVSLQRPL